MMPEKIQHAEPWLNQEEKPADRVATRIWPLWILLGLILVGGAVVTFMAFQKSWAEKAESYCFEQGSTNRFHWFDFNRNDEVDSEREFDTIVCGQR